MKSHRLPGRLGNPASTLLTDRRADPRIAAALAAMGDLAADIDPIAADSSYEDCLAYCSAFEATAALAHPLLEAVMPPFDDGSRVCQMAQ